MKSIKELQKIIEKELAGISYPENPADLYTPIDYVLGLGGKRMRPILLLLAHQLFNQNLSTAIKPALGVEVFHNFTLLHDDIMDDAPLRRGQQTVHEKWNPNVAILSGDTMLVQAYQLISEVPSAVLKKSLDVFSKTAVEVCEGQQWDMDFEERDDVTIPEYLKMIEYKTAVLLGAALKMGAIIGGSNEKQAAALYEFGRNIGIAFQLKDDLLDVFGNKNSFGKQIGGDIISRKKTCLYLMSLSLSKDEQIMELVNLYSSDSINDIERVERIKSIYSSLNIKEHIDNLIDNYYTKAMDSLSIIDGELSELELFASILKTREK